MELAALIFLSTKYPGKTLHRKHIEDRLADKLVHKSRIYEMPQRESGG